MGVCGCQPDRHKRIDKPDEYQPEGLPYLLDVTRDGGSIAREALE